MMDVSIIIVNYNTGDLIRSCLDSVLKQTDLTYEVIVVDNASMDHSVHAIDQYRNEIQLIANQENKGFGRANNQAAKMAKGEFLFLLNPDAILQNKNALRGMLDYMKQNPMIGIAGTQVARKKGGYSAPQKTYPGQRYTSVDFSSLPGSIAWVIGASMMIRRSVFEAVQGFDEDYFLYGEEADLCLRVRKQGYAIGYNPTVLVNHIGGASEQWSSTRELWRKKQNGLHLFLQKNYPWPDACNVVKRQLRRARRKYFFLTLSQWFGRFDDNKKRKRERYQVVLETSEAFLRKKT